MPDTKISAGADPGTLLATDKTPVARSGSTTAYAATMAEFASYANGTYTPNYYTGTPSMDATGAAGTAAFVSRGDHVHPSDTSRLPLGGGTMTGLLTLSGVPTATLHAATKGYVDTATGGSTAAIPGANYADNPGFAINQRGYTTGTALAAGAFGHDRWKGGASGVTYTFTQSGNPATTVTITAGTLQQVVEGAALVGGTYALSWTGTAQGRVGAGSYAASPVAASVTASANTTIEFNTGTVGRVKFEVGSTATPWVANSPQTDLANCQRFYCTGGFNLSVYAGGAGAGLSVSQTFPVTMRAAPTMTTVGATASNMTGVALPVSSLGTFNIQGVSGPVATACSYYGNYTASADL